MIISWWNSKSIIKKNYNLKRKFITKLKFKKEANYKINIHDTLFMIEPAS